MRLTNKDIEKSLEDQRDTPTALNAILACLPDTLKKKPHEYV